MPSLWSLLRLLGMISVSNIQVAILVRPAIMKYQSGWLLKEKKKRKRTKAMYSLQFWKMRSPVPRGEWLASCRWPHHPSGHIIPLQKERGRGTGRSEGAPSHEGSGSYFTNPSCNIFPTPKARPLIYCWAQSPFKDHISRYC